jgi:DNA-binding transcriptional MerR regulator
MKKNDPNEIKQIIQHLQKIGIALDNINEQLEKLYDKHINSPKNDRPKR